MSHPQIYICLCWHLIIHRHIVTHNKANMYTFTFTLIYIFTYICLDTSYHFWLYLYFLNILYFFKYSCTNIFHRRSLCTFYKYCEKYSHDLFVVMLKVPLIYCAWTWVTEEAKVVYLITWHTGCNSYTHAHIHAPTMIYFNYIFHHYSKEVCPNKTYVKRIWLTIQLLSEELHFTWPEWVLYLT